MERSSLASVQVNAHQPAPVVGPLQGSSVLAGMVFQGCAILETINGAEDASGGIYFNSVKSEPEASDPAERM